ncbi:MAG: NAD(P)H-dependent glycerol-3-phosphate dehydrogenase [Bacteroidota bacterium]
MNDQSKNLETVGVIGAGSFGTAVSNLLALNTKVILYSRRSEIARAINEERFRYGVPIHDRVEATNDLSLVTSSCQLLFVFVPSDAFRTVMQQMASLLNPSHLIVHGTKGLDVTQLTETDYRQIEKVNREQIHVMSSVIKQETSVVRVGIMSGPNLARELLDGQPTATLIASKFQEVIERAKEVLKSEQLHVFGSYDLLGAELAGALKNVIALGSGILKGFGLGKNIQAMLITRGLHEMVQLGQYFGSDATAFFGTAGIGDLIATATSKKSRNFLFGFRLGKGETLDEVLSTNVELAEGVRTLALVNGLSLAHRLRLPICQTLFRVVYQDFDMDSAMKYLITYPYDVDVAFSTNSN